MAVLFLSCNFSSWYLFIFIIFFGHEIKIVVVVVVVVLLLLLPRRGTVKVKCLAQEHNMRTLVGFQPGLTQSGIHHTKPLRPLCLPQFKTNFPILSPLFISLIWGTEIDVQLGEFHFVF